MAKIKKKQPSCLIVTQANQLVSARYALSLVEQRLVLSMIARIQPEDEDFKEYEVGIAELAKFAGVDPNSAYRECKKITENLLNRVLKIEEPGRLLQTGWVSSADYIDGEGCVKLCFDPKLKPYLLQLKGNFTSCKLEMLLSFKSQYTVRVYMALKQYEKIKEREIGLDELRGIFGLRQDQYQDYKHFKSRILLPTQKELNAKADLTFEFHEIKSGRRVVTIRFNIFAKKRTEVLLENKLAQFASEQQSVATDDHAISFEFELLERLLQHGITEQLAITWIMKDKKHIQAVVDHVESMYKNQKVKSSTAGLIRTLFEHKAIVGVTPFEEQKVQQQQAKKAEEKRKIDEKQQQERKNKFKTQRNQTIMDILSNVETQQWIAVYLKENPEKIKSYNIKKEDFCNIAEKMTFRSWLCNRIVPEATPEEYQVWCDNNNVVLPPFCSPPVSHIELTEQ